MRTSIAKSRAASIDGAPRPEPITFGGAPATASASAEPPPCIVCDRPAVETVEPRFNRLARPQPARGSHSPQTHRAGPPVHGPWSTVHLSIHPA